MKKIAILTAISLCMAATAFAADSINLNFTNTGLSLWGSKTTAVSGTGLIGKTSTGVGLGVKTAPTGYAAVTQHKNGTKAFGSSHDSTAVFSTDVPTVGTPVTGPTTADSALFSSGWTAM